jgi:hypothetical protein
MSEDVLEERVLELLRGMVRGEGLDILALPDLTPDEQAAVDRLRERAKQEKRPENAANARRPPAQP